jgi:penicillin G amidase
MRRTILWLLALTACACSPPATPARRLRAPLPQVDGSLVLPGLSQPVTVTRDRWGIPHITARNEHDLFFAQGFVQAQDRLFQMDLWRRSAQGGLAQVLGPNFIDRDVMTARIQYHGDMAAEWASYPADTARIADAFVSGINAWVFRARAQLPDEFVLAGWIPDVWSKDDLLNRTDAFLASGDSELEAFRAQLMAEVGERRADALLPSLARLKRWPVADLDAAGRAVADALHRAGAPPYFAGFAASLAGSNAWAIPANRTVSGSPLLAADPHRPLTSPSLRYLVHLKAPGWNVIGATAPWRPGVVIGHNDHVAWGMAAHSVNTQDIRVEPAASTTAVKGSLLVKNHGPFAFDRAYTPHGVVIASDREHQLVFTLGWTGFESGAAPELGALAFDRAGSIVELRAAIAGWKMPIVDVVYADRSTVGRQLSGAFGAASASPGGMPIAANGSLARTNRLRQLLGERSKYTVDDIKREQHDVTSWNAAQMVPRLAAVRSNDARAEAARRRLVAWDRRLTSDSEAGALYVLWERSLWRQMASARVPPPLVDAYLTRVPFDLSEALKESDSTLLTALSTAAARAESEPESGYARALFQHPLAITQSTRRRFNVGPFRPGGYESTVMSLSATRNADVGPSFRQILDVSDWDRSVATNAPGQSEWTSSTHFADLAKLWAAGEYFPLSFSDRAVRENAESTLVLQPKK